MSDDTQVDTTNTDPAYWDEVLRREGLSMSRGKFVKQAPHSKGIISYSGNLGRGSGDDPIVYKDKKLEDLDNAS